jgi:uncharacterized protein YbjT (DUF2867 family)
MVQARTPLPLTLVMGATGKTGGAVAAALLMRGAPVRAVVRTRDARSERLRALGADLAVTDMADPAGMEAAFRGVRRAYWAAPFDPRALDAAHVFAAAAREVRLESLVSLGQWLAGPNHPSLATRHAHAIGQLFDALPETMHTALIPGFFADNYLRLIGFAAQLGVLPSLTGDSRNAPPSTEDIARVAVAVLSDPGPHAGRRYRPTGPELISTADMAAVLSGVLGRRVRRVEMPLWLFLKAARLQQVPAYELSGFRHYVRDHRQGAFAIGAPTTVVRDLTGREAEDFATIAARYAALPAVRRSLGSVARAWADFLRTPLMPGYDLEALEHRLGATPPPGARPALEDAAWRAAHGAGPAAAQTA